MITVIRRYFKGGSQVLLWIIIASFVIGLLPSAFRQLSQSGQWAMRVNGQDIGYRDFLHEVNKQRQRINAFRMQYGEYADWLLNAMQMSDPKSMAFRVLVREELVNQFGDKLGIHLNPDYIMQQMNDPQFVQDELGNVMPPQLVDQYGGINQQLLQQYLKYAGLTTDIFERQIERALMDNVVRDLIGASIYVPEFDLKQKYQTDHAKKNFSILTLSKQKILDEVRKKDVTDADLEAFFNEQNDKAKRYWVSEKRSGTMWTFAPKNYQIVIPNDRVKAYYEKNKVKEFIDQPATVQVRRILLKIPKESERAKIQDTIGRLRDEILPNPDKFAEYAKQYSQDEATAKDGGLMKPFTRGGQEHIFDKTAFLLKKDGEISSVIETSQGYEMLQRVSKKKQAFKSFDAVKNEIKNQLVHKKFAEQFSADMKEIVATYNQTGNDAALRTLVKEKDGALKQLQNELHEESSVSDHLFKLKKDQMTVFVDDNSGIVLKLTDIQERYVPPFESVKNTVKADYLEEQATKELSKRMEQARQALSENEPLQKIQKRFDGSVMQTGWLEASNPDGAASLQKLGIPVTQMLQLEKPNAVLSHIADNGGYLVRLDEIAPLNQEEYTAKRAEFVDQFVNERTQQYMEGFVASLHRNATIETNESLVTLQD